MPGEICIKEWVEGAGCQIPYHHRQKESHQKITPRVYCPLAIGRGWKSQLRYRPQRQQRHTASDQESSLFPHARAKAAAEHATDDSRADACGEKEAEGKRPLPLRRELRD